MHLEREREPRSVVTAYLGIRMQCILAGSKEKREQMSGSVRR